MSTAAPSPTPAFVKGDVVEFRMSNSMRVVRGIVTRKATPKGRVEVYAGHGEAFMVPHSMLRKVTDLVIPVAGPMSNYTVRRYKAVQRLSEETSCFTCDIVRVSDGAVVAFVSNRGQGSADKLDANTRVFGPNVAQEIRNQLERDAAAWTKWAGLVGESYCEHLALWMEWERCYRPMGNTASDFCAAYFKEVHRF